MTRATTGIPRNEAAGALCRARMQKDRMHAYAHAGNLACDDCRADIDQLIDATDAKSLVVDQSLVTAVVKIANALSLAHIGDPLYGLDDKGQPVWSDEGRMRLLREAAHLLTFVRPPVDAPAPSGRAEIKYERTDSGFHRIEVVCSTKGEADRILAALDGGKQGEDGR